MLSERIIKNPSSIKVLPPGLEEKKVAESNTFMPGDKNQESEGEWKLYYGTFTLTDDPYTEPSLIEFPYWKLPESYELPIKENCFLYIAEKKEGRTVDSYRFFFRCNGSKPILSWSIDKMSPLRRFEPGAHEITIRWNRGSGERIRSEYIYLYPRNKPDEQYQFLSDYISPTESDAGTGIDRYVFFPGDGMQASDFRIGFAPLLLEKYDVTYR